MATEVVLAALLWWREGGLVMGSDVDVEALKKLPGGGVDVEKVRVYSC